MYSALEVVPGMVTYLYAQRIQWTKESKTVHEIEEAMGQSGDSCVQPPAHDQNLI